MFITWAIPNKLNNIAWLNRFLIVFIIVSFGLFPTNMRQSFDASMILLQHL